MQNIKLLFNNLSIKWKIFLFLLSFCASLIVLLWFFQVVFLDDFYRKIKINEIKVSASEIIKNIDSDNLSEIINQLSEEKGVCIKISNELAKEKYSSHLLRDCTIHKLNGFDLKSIFEKTIENSNEYFVYFDINKLRIEKYKAFELTEAQPSNAIEKSDSFETKEIPPSPVDEHQQNKTVPSTQYTKIIKGKFEPQTMLYSKIIQNKAGESIHVLINSVISPVNTTVTTIRIQLYFVTGFMLIFSIILALLIAKKVSKPIEEINESAKALAKGKYDIEFTGGGYKEIRELSNTLNYTAKELYKVESLRQELIANISHDLRTPLTLISGYAEAMRDLPNENTSENAQVIVDESNRLATLVNDALDISKLQSGMQNLSISTFNLTKSIAETIDRINELVKNDGYSISFVYTDEVTVAADEIKITQAFYNLLINAINYTGADKKIAIIQIINDNNVKIEIADTGEGVSKENLPYIWDRYYKIDKTHKRPIAGTGLGLSIVKSIIDMHGGEYGVISVPNDGSTFWFSLKL